MVGSSGGTGEGAPTSVHYRQKEVHLEVAAGAETKPSGPPPHLRPSPYWATENDQGERSIATGEGLPVERLGHRLFGRPRIPIAGSSSAGVHVGPREDSLRHLSPPCLFRHYRLCLLVFL